MCLIPGSSTFGSNFRTGLKSSFNNCLANPLFLLFLGEKKKIHVSSESSCNIPRGICPRLCKLLTFQLAMSYKHTKGYGCTFRFLIIFQLLYLRSPFKVTLCCCYCCCFVYTLLDTHFI